MSKDLLRTPGGLRPKSLDHLIEPGHAVRWENNHMQKVDSNENMVADLGIDPLGSDTKPLVSRKAPGGAPSGWLTWVSSDDPNSNVRTFKTTWVVPPPPTQNNGQLIYPFNGMEDGGWIVQPVLQWGNNGSFGGNYWAI